MGWWPQDEEGHSFAGDGTLMWGDGPADVVDAALEAVRADFRRGLGREPTVAELRAGIEFSLGVLEEA